MFEDAKDLENEKKKQKIKKKEIVLVNVLFKLSKLKRLLKFSFVVALAFCCLSISCLKRTTLLAKFFHLWQQRCQN